MEYKTWGVESYFRYHQNDDDTWSIVDNHGHFLAACDLESDAIKIISALLMVEKVQRTNSRIEDQLQKDN